MSAIPNLLKPAARDYLHFGLGGKETVLDFANADLESMAHALTLGATYNSGQNFNAATRVFAHKASTETRSMPLLALCSRSPSAFPGAKESTSAR